MIGWIRHGDDTDQLDWDRERDGRMLDHADYEPVVTVPGSHPRPPVDPANDPVTDVAPIIVKGQL